MTKTHDPAGFRYKIENIADYMCDVYCYEEPDYFAEITVDRDNPKEGMVYWTSEGEQGEPNESHKQIYAHFKETIDNSINPGGIAAPDRDYKEFYDQGQVKLAIMTGKLVSAAREAKKFKQERNFLGLMFWALWISTSICVFLFM